MASELLRGTGPTGPCPYLSGETARFEYRYLAQIESEEYEALLARGWRRQGMSFFRPACPSCNQCRGLRVAADDFSPSKSQRRCLKRNSDVRLVIRRASVSLAHIRLFNAYHADMQVRRDWPDDSTTATEYFEQFLSGNFPFASEFVYLRGKRIIGIGLVDVTPHCLSSVYFYHDPAWRPSGPGTFSALKELEFARGTDRRWLYLGYWIAGNQSMAYKNRFRPHEVIESYISDGEVPVWRRESRE